MAINRVYASILRVEDRVRELVIINIFQAIAVLAGSYLAISVAGLAGIGYVWLATHGVVSIYAILAMQFFRRGRASPGS